MTKKIPEDNSDRRPVGGVRALALSFAVSLAYVLAGVLLFDYFDIHLYYGEELIVGSSLLVFFVTMVTLGNYFWPYCQFCKTAPCQEKPCPKCGHYARTSHALKQGAQACECV